MKRLAIAACLLSCHDSREVHVAVGSNIDVRVDTNGSVNNEKNTAEVVVSVSGVVLVPIMIPMPMPYAVAPVTAEKAQ